MNLKFLLKDEIKLYFKIVNSNDIIGLWNVDAFAVATIKYGDPYSVYI